MSAELANALYGRLYDQLDNVENVYPMRLPEGADLPSIVYQQISGQRGATHSGDHGPHRTTWQVTVWAASYEQAKMLAAEVEGALNTWVDRTGTYTTESVALVGGLIDLFDEPSRLYYIPIDVVLLYVP